MASYSPIFSWILAQQHIIIKNLSTHIYLEDGSIIPLKDFDLSIKNHAHHYLINGQAKLGLSPITKVRLLAKMTLESKDLNKADGHAFLVLKNLNLVQLNRFFPQKIRSIKRGQGDTQLWLDWQAGHIDAMQSRIKIKNLAWRDSSLSGLKKLEANLAWRATQYGWQLTADQVKVRSENRQWPTNKLMIRYQNHHEMYSLYLSNIRLESIIPIASFLPARLNPILSLHPHGDLQDVQLHFKKGELTRVLTQFSKLGWQAHDLFPGAENIAGVFAWKPSEGRLDLDSNQTVLNPKLQPSVTLSTLNASIHWTTLNDALYVTLTRLVITHPNLLVDVTGDVVNLAGQMNLIIHIAANEAERWLTYLPSSYLKPKLEVWLKQDIKKIKHIIGDITVQGKMADFPFDTQPGEFLMKVYAQGVDLLAALGWPLTKNLDALLYVDKRNLEITIIAADLQGNQVDNGSIRINDIGLDP